MTPKRDWDDPKYKAFRAAVRKRDKSTCQMPSCGSKRAVKVHHIFTWAKFPHLRYDVKNGICLCRKCHDSISKKEHFFVRMFLSIISKKT